MGDRMVLSGGEITCTNCQSGSILLTSTETKRPQPSHFSFLLNYSTQNSQGEEHLLPGEEETEKFCFPKVILYDLDIEERKVYESSQGIFHNWERSILFV